MPDTALQNAERRRDEFAVKINAAQAQIDDWRREIKRIDQFIQDWHLFAGTADGGSEPEQEATVVDPDTAPAAKRTTGNSDKEAVARVARLLIEAEGKPIPRDELLLRLRERGLVIEGSQPETVLSTMLWRMKDKAKIVHIRRHGYWLADQAYGEGSYYPDVNGDPEKAVETADLTNEFLQNLKS